MNWEDLPIDEFGLPRDEDGMVPVEALLIICHDNAHNAEHDVEDGVLVSLTKREIWLITLAMLTVGEAADCLEDNCADLVERIVELMDVQKPHWRQREGEEE